MSDVDKELSESSASSYSVDVSDGRGQIEYAVGDAEAFIGFREIECRDGVISFWKSGFYQGSVNTETNRLFYGNDEVDFSISVPQEFIDKVQSEVTQ